MNKMIIRIVISVAAAVALSACSSTDENRADITPEKLQSLKEENQSLEKEAQSHQEEAQSLGQALEQALNPSWIPLSTGLHLDFSATTSQPTDASVTMIESDGRGTFHVTYMVDGVEQRIPLTPEELVSRTQYAKHQQGNPSYWIWDHSGLFTVAPEFKYFNILGWAVDEYETAQDGSNGDLLNISTGYIVYGTPTEVLPGSGTASYDGRVRLNGRSRTNPVGRESIDGDMDLTADFENRSIEGMFSNLADRDSGAQFTPAEIVVQSATIANGGFDAQLVGQPAAAGLTGTATGQFFGPDAAEVGGVISAEDADTVFEGHFGGKKAQ